MKEKIHPNYHEISVTCACGNKFVTSSCIESKELKLDICDKCHPFFTGTQKLVDISGRVEKFQKRLKK